MIELDLSLWTKFEESGKVDDYLAFRSSVDETEEEQENAFYN